MKKLTKPGGIMLKTFLFTSTLIALVISVTLGTLYFIMPDYYFYMKKAHIEKAAESLKQSLNSETDSTVIKSKLAEFCEKTNTTVLSVKGDYIVLNLTSPFVNADEDLATIYSALGEGFSITSAFVEARPAAPVEGGAAAIRGRTGLRGDTQIFRLDIEVNNPHVSKIFIESTLQPISEAKQVILNLMPYLFVLDILIALIFAYFYSRQFTSPILKISAAAKRMQSMDKNVRSAVDSSDELGGLSQNLDSLYENLCDNIDRLQNETQRATRLERSKTEFMRAASHELKTPIAALSGIVEGMLDDVGVYKDKEKYLNESKSLIRRLSVTVYEILEASRNDTADIVPVFEEVDLKAYIGEKTGELAVLAATKNLTFNLEGLDNGFTVLSDHRLLTVALSNILTNAVRYADPDTAILIAKDGERLRVFNKCPYIPEEQLVRLFEPFYTLSYSRDRSQSGTGIGLYIVKKNLDALGLPFSLTNAGGGVMFEITLKDTLPSDIPDMTE